MCLLLVSILSHHLLNNVDAISLWKGKGEGGTDHVHSDASLLF